MTSRFNQILGVLDAMVDDFYGQHATYLRGAASLGITICPEQEWTGTVDGEYAYNVNRALWSFTMSTDFVELFARPQVGDVINLARSPENKAYRVINHDKNECWSRKHGQNSDTRIIVCTTEVQQ